MEALGVEHLPVCMAKTQKSFSDNAKLLGRPSGFNIEVREFEYAVGAGFVIPILGKMMRMPGLPATPASEGMEIEGVWNPNDNWTFSFNVAQQEVVRNLLTNGWLQSKRKWSTMQ